MQKRLKTLPTQELERAICEEEKVQIMKILERPVMVAQVEYHIRAEQSINGKETTEYIHKVSMI